MEIGSETVNAALRQFSSSDESMRQEGFAKLVKRSRPYLHSLLVHRLPSESDREDVVEEVFHRVWRLRDRLEFVEFGPWCRFIRKLAHNCSVDLLRTPNASVSVDDPAFADIPAGEQKRVDALVEAMEDRRTIYRLADEAFLDLPVDMSERDRTRHLLAAKLLLVDKLPWRTVCRILNSGLEEEAKIGRADLDRILSDGSLLRQLAFTELHWGNDELCDFLLKPETGVVQAVAEAEGIGEQIVILAIQLRFRHAMLLDQISSRLNSQIKKSFLISVFDSCVQRFPFVEIMHGLYRDMGSIPGAKGQLASSGLWNRLIFQYFCENELPHRDIYDRTAAAASVAGFDVTLAKLNVALSNGRLFNRLAEQLDRRAQSAGDR